MTQAPKHGRLLCTSKHENNELKNCGKIVSAALIF